MAHMPALSGEEAILIFNKREHPVRAAWPHHNLVGVYARGCPFLVGILHEPAVHGSNP
jgi:hypothetical protein